MVALLFFALLVITEQPCHGVESSRSGSFDDAWKQESNHLASRHKRELPINSNCDPGSNSAYLKCYKGDLVDESIADCERSSWVYTCNPINDGSASIVVDLPDKSRYGVDCLADQSKRMICGSKGSDTRCVCDSRSFSEESEYYINFNHCRCQYWPKYDVRARLPAYCTQSDHGGTTGFHFFTCCNNCNDPTDRSCDGTTYQGLSNENYCGSCGVPNEKTQGRTTYQFNCESCKKQEECKNECTRFYDFPGLCWRFGRCFRGCCLRDQSDSTFTSKSNFCGDGSCDMNENEISCPSDCCQSVNPHDCAAKNGICPLECCGDPTCCKTEDAQPCSDAISKLGTLVLILLITLPVTIVPLLM